MIKSGKHLRVVRSWMQRNFLNGDRVIWGSSDPLVGKTLTPLILEELAQEIRDAVLKEFKIKDDDDL